MTKHHGAEVEPLPLYGPTDAQAQAALALLQPLLLAFLLLSLFYCCCSLSGCIAAGMRRLKGYGAWWERPEGEPRWTSAPPRPPQNHRS